MNSLPLDGALPVVQDLAGRKASAFVRRCGLGADEWEDVRSQLILTFLVRWPKFDGEKASVRTFASRVMDKELMSILRYRLAEGRRPQDVPARDPGPNPAYLRHFRIDIERVLAPLPAPIQAAAVALSMESTVAAAEALGCSRQMISRRKQLIRQAFLSSGIGPDYFTAGGAQ